MERPVIRGFLDELKQSHLKIFFVPATFLKEICHTREYVHMDTMHAETLFALAMPIGP
jgi:hypothetical protein